MTPIQTIGFSAEDLDRVTASLGLNGCATVQVSTTAELQPDGASLVCGEGVGWLETVREIRAIHPYMALVVVTRIPDTSKWLDALGAGATDYCCLPLDRRQVDWLLPMLITDAA